MDIELHYIEKGRGEPFIFLHGNGEDGSYFKNQTEHYKDKYCTIALDTRGHGKSPRGEAPFTLGQFSDDLYEFMKAHEIGGAVLLGFSDGANIAMEFAMKHGDMLKALILNGGNLNPKGLKPTTRISIEIAYKKAMRRAEKSPEAKDEVEMLGLMVNEPNIEPCELSKITVPTLVICGTRDVISTDHTRLIAESIPGAVLKIIGGNHFVANKRPEKFNEAVDDFLSAI